MLCCIIFSFFKQVWQCLSLYGSNCVVVLYWLICVSSKVIFLPVFFPLYCSYISLFFFHSALFSFLFFPLMKLVLFIRLELNSLAQLVLLPWSDGEYVCIIMVGLVNILLLLYRNNIFFRYVWFLCWKVKCSGFLFCFEAVLF